MQFIRHLFVFLTIMLFYACATGHAQLIPFEEYVGQELPAWRSIHSKNLTVELKPIKPSGMQMQTKRLSAGGGWIYPELSFYQKPLNLAGVKVFTVLVQVQAPFTPVVIKLHLKDTNNISYYTKKGVRLTKPDQSLVFKRDDFESKSRKQKKTLDWEHIAAMTLGYSIGPDDQPVEHLVIKSIEVEAEKKPAVKLDYDAFIFPGNINVFTVSQPVQFDCLATGELTIINGLGHTVKKLSLPTPQTVKLATLPSGFYRIKANDYLNYFTVVADAKDYPDQSGNVFGVDYGMATAPSWEQSEAQRAATMAQMAGLDYVRERLNLVGIFKSHDLNELRQSPWFEKTFNAYQANTQADLKVVAKFLETPARLRADGNIRKVADDLFAFERMLTLLDEKLHPLIDCWEIFNEINLRNFYEGTAWEYAAMQKVAYLMLKKRSPQKLIVGPSYSQPSPQLRDVLHRNGMDDYYDVANFHTYAGVDTAMGYSANFIDSMDQITQTTMPVWCTETGIETHGLYARDSSEEAVQKLHHYASLVAPLMTNINAAGTEKVFYFYWKSVFTFLCVLDRKFMATECYAAIATLNRMLGGQYAGTHHYSDDVWAHRYDTSKGPRLIVCSKTYPARVSLKLHGNYQIVAMTGEIISSGHTVDGTLDLSLDDEAVYVSADQFNDTFESVAVARDVIERPSQRSDLVIDVRLDPNAKYNTPLAMLELDPGQRYDGLVHVYNFSDKPFSGRLNISDTGQWHVKVFEPTFTVKPREKYTTSIELIAPSSTGSGVQMTDVQLSIPSSNSVASLRLSLDRRHLPPQEVRPLFESLKDLKWTVAQDSAHQTETYRSLGDQGNFFKVDFIENGHRMFWPVLKSFPNGNQLVDMSQFDAICFEVDIKEIRPGTWYMCTFTEANGARYGSSTRIHCDQPGRYKMVFPFSSFVYLSNFSAFDGPQFTLDLDKIKAIGLGLNTNKKHKGNQSMQYSIEYVIDGITLIKY